MRISDVCCLLPDITWLKDNMHSRTPFETSYCHTYFTISQQWMIQLILLSRTSVSSPEEPYKDVADAYKVPKSTLYGLSPFLNMPLMLPPHLVVSLSSTMSSWSSKSMSGQAEGPYDLSIRCRAGWSRLWVILGASWTYRVVQQHKDHLLT